MSSDTKDHSLQREIVSIRARATTISTAGVTDNLDGWLTDRANEHGLDTLLAFADDGVIWGKVEAGTLITASVAPLAPAPELRLGTLQTAHLFGERAEMRLWPDATRGWSAVLLHEVENDPHAPWTAAFDEEQIVWGTDPIGEPVNGFTLLRDNVQGLVHAVPYPLQDHFGADKRPLSLKVRYYLSEDETGGTTRDAETSGFTRVVACRLVKLLGPKDKDKESGL